MCVCARRRTTLRGVLLLVEADVRGAWGMIDLHHLRNIIQQQQWLSATFPSDLPAKNCAISAACTV